MPVNIVTTEDLQLFKKELLAEIKTLLDVKPAAQTQWLKSYQVREMLGYQEAHCKTFA